MGTTGCVSACLFREFQLSASYEGLVETVPGVNQSVLRMDNYEIDKSKDTLFRGEFEVVKELLATFEDGAASKRECDKVIDKNGPKPKGTGIKQLILFLHTFWWQFHTYPSSGLRLEK